MRTIKAAIDDYIADFKLKNPEEKARAIRKLIIELVIFLIIICSPAIATQVDHILEKDLRSRVSPELSIDQKWHLVQTGRMHIECEPDAGEELKKAGIDPNSSDAMDYAVEHDLCDFALNQ